MFLINPGRYIVADPAILLSEMSFKRLWGSSTRFGALVLENGKNVLYALPTSHKGDFKTSLGTSITTQTGYIAFAPYEAVEKLLPFNVIRLSLSATTLLYFSSSNIILDGQLIIYGDPGQDF